MAQQHTPYHDEENSGQMDVAGKAALQPDRRFASVSQKRISPATMFSVRPSSSEKSWIIPLNYLTASSPQNVTNLWLDEPTKSCNWGSGTEIVQTERGTEGLLSRVL
ncbi:hypothetical protein RvY_16513-2 [Ramazzottius varieornatus]|uniref:Uncharacterized protein n=1 Tax=Ramazzottius varieornatus TaxID=947166 RepID=A0A1D1VYR8_RAMVA|nr:hypothetical protein RvY_16513-2 [Ramazzottius varieornatus]